MAFKILPFFGRSVEKHTVDLMQKHSQKLLVLNKIFTEVGKAAVKGNFKIVALKAKDVSTIEHEADVLRREILSQLYGGAFLPGMRTQLYNLVNMLDGVANRIQDAVQSFVYLKDKNFCAKAKDIFSKLIAETTKSIDLLVTALEDLIEGRPELVGHVKEVLAIEHKIDLLGREMFDYLFFNRKLDYLSDRVICDVTNFIMWISDMAENCCDQMELLKILRQA